MLNINIKKTIQINSLIILISLFFTNPSFAGKEKTIIIFPFNFFADKDTSILKKSLTEESALMLAKRGFKIKGIERVKDKVINENVSVFDEETVDEVLAKSKAQFALYANLTKVKDNWSIDFYYKSSKDEKFNKVLTKVASTDDLLLVVRNLTDRVYKDIIFYIETEEKDKEREQYKKGVISEFIVKGLQRVSKEALLNKMDLKLGDKPKSDVLRRDVRKIYSLGYFDDIKVFFEDDSVLIIEVKEKPFIKEINFKGNDDVSDEKILETIKLKTGTVVDHVLINEAKDAIKNLHIEKGYYLASVEPQVATDNVEAVVTFKIKENEKVKVRRIIFKGNKVFKVKEIKKQMQTKEKNFFSFMTKRGTFHELLLENDMYLLKDFYLNRGYIDFKVVDKKVFLSEDKKHFYITIVMSEGKKYEIGNIIFTGDLLPNVSEKKYRKEFGLKKGNVFNKSKLIAGLEKVKNIYGDKGYINVEVNPVTEKKGNVVNFKVDIIKNEPVYIERIEITGNNKTRDKVILRELYLTEGELFTLSGKNESTNALRRLGYFDYVNLTSSPGSSPDKVKLNIDLVDRLATGQFSLGVGYSSVDHLVTNISLSQQNFLGTGLKLSLNGSFSSTTTRYNFSITEPWLFDYPISGGISVYEVTRQYDSFTEQSKGFSASLGFPIYFRKLRGFLMYRAELSQIYDIDANSPESIISQEGEKIESAVRAIISHDTKNRHFFATEGHTISLFGEVAGGSFLGGDNYFIKTEATAIQYIPFYGNTNFAIRLKLGRVRGFEDHHVPVGEKYYLGGMFNIRGFKTRSVGPIDFDSNNYIGGETMGFINAEYLFNISQAQNFKGVLFFDAGNNYENDDVDLSYIRGSVGAGLRWLSPVGPLRIEWAWNLDPEEYENRTMWEFTIGNAF